VLLASELNVRGTIDVSALDGDRGSVDGTGGGGGGAGGSLLLSAGSVVLDPGSVANPQLAARGGAGGAKFTPSSGGFVGGAGAPGRIYIATPSLSVVGGTLSASPAPVVTANALLAFPR